MSVNVAFGMTLRTFVDQTPEFTAEADSIAQLLSIIRETYPEAGRVILDEDGGLRDFINIYVGDVNIRSLKGPGTALSEGDEVTILPAIAGGSGSEAEHGESDTAAPRIVPRTRSGSEALISKERFKEVQLDDKSVLRYNNHIQLRQLSVKGQKRLCAARVLVIGLGALGSVVARTLAASGIGAIGLADSDDVELGNLQTQTIHTTRDIGRPKTASAKDAIRKLNPSVAVTVHQERLTSDNIMDAIADYDVVVDATDNYVSRYLISDACVLSGKPEVYGAIYQFEGAVSLFDAIHWPCLRCQIPSPPPADLVPTCSASGMAAPMPDVIGGVMAAEVLKLLAGGGRPLIGRLYTCDLWNMSTRIVEIPKDEGCAICGLRPTITSVEEIDYEDFCGLKASEEEEPVEGIEAEELIRRISAGEAITIVDVREPHERTAMRFAGAITIPIGQLARRKRELDPSIDTVFICKEGKRSILAIRTLREAGYEGPLYNLKGGLDASAEIMFPNEGAWL